MKYCIIVFGCQMNVSDAERVARVMSLAGYEQIENSRIEEADAAVVVACSIRQSAIDRIYGLKRKFNALKDKKPFTTILTGCIMKGDKKKMYLFFDIVFDINNLQNLPKLLANKDGREIRDYLAIHPIYSNTFQAGVPISKGCNQLCHYCVVPYTRGPETYRDPDEIVAECRDLVAKGYKEITLLGQTVNSYNHKKCNFAQLMKRIDSLRGDFWLRFISSHPNFFTKEFIGVWKRSDHIAPYLHLAVQSGDDDVLKKMNRRYTVEKFCDVVKEIREAIPNLAVSTDAIVGYSSETKKQFQKTVKLFSEMRFDMAYISQYSVRKGTAGEKLYTDDVPKAEKKRRDAALTRVLEKTALENNKKYKGKVLRVLFEKHFKGHVVGKSDTYKTVKVRTGKGAPDRVGTFADVKISRATPWGLYGKIATYEKKKK